MNERRAILLGGLGAGILDITYAIVVSRLLRGTDAVTVLQSVASGLLGKGAYDGGAATAALGLFLHFVIAFTAAAFYVLASRRLPTLVRRPWLWGALYGMAVYLFMNFVVLPLSAFPHKLSFPPLVLARGLAGHIVCVGLPIALAAAFTWRSSRRER
ncbi:MAG: hypothetical protein ABUT39_04775 [Acidobacteriota bacterium]